MPADLGFAPPFYLIRVSRPIRPVTTAKINPKTPRTNPTTVSAPRAFKMVERDEGSAELADILAEDVGHRRELMTVSDTCEEVEKDVGIGSRLS
jgi:hypothetical protein